MSNSTDTTGCISHKQNCRFFVIYEDFRDIARRASGTEHEYKLAAFWRVLETKMNDRITSLSEMAEECKKKGVPIPEEYLWVEMSYADFVRRAQGVYKASSFQVAAAESERLGFSKSRTLKRPYNPTDPESRLVEYKEYLFLADVMQTTLTTGELPPPIEINSPLLKAIPERKAKKKEKRAIEKNRESLLKSIAPPIEINTSPLLNSIGNKNSSNDITKNITNDKDTREREHDTPTGASSLSFDASRSDFMACAYCFEPMATRCAHCGKRVCEIHGTGTPDDIWCPACLFLAQQTDRPPVVIDAPPQPSSYSDPDTRSTMTTGNALTDEDSCEDVSQQKGQGQSHDHNGNSGLHRRGHNRSDNGPCSSSITSTQGLEKGHVDAARPVDSIQSGNPGLPGALASVTGHVPTPVEAHPVETPPRLAVESGRSATAPETPAPQPAHTGHSAVSAVVGARSLPAKPPTSGRQESTSKDKPETEPDMSGKWNSDRCVEYAEWCNERRYTVKMREEQFKAACAIHKNDTALTLEQFKAAYDERNDAWWQEHKGKLHVNDMKAKGSSGIDRVHEMLQRIEDRASKKRTASHLQVIPGGALPPPANAFIARSLDKDYNRQKLEQMRAEVARKQQMQQIGV